MGLHKRLFKDYMELIFWKEEEANEEDQFWR